MRKSLLLIGSLVALGGVGTVLAQTTVDGLDLDAINKAAQVHARNLGQFVDEVLGHQAKANADQADELEDLVATSRAKMQAVAAAKAKANPTGDQVDLDALVADAGRSMAPSAQSASQSTPMLIAFASLSMPPESLKRMITDVSKAGGMVVFRGFSPGGPKPFMAALHEAIGDTTGAHVSIDPRLFRAYGVEAVPTYVAASSSFDLCSGEDCASSPAPYDRPPYDRISGNVTTHFALETIAQGHGPGAPVAKTALANLERTP